MTQTPPRRPHDEGVALVLVMVLMLIAAVVTGSLMLLAQSETYAGLNYRVMTQARYGAEAGIHRAVNHFLSPGYTPPAPGSLGTFTNTVSPVTFGGNPVVLSAKTGVSSNHPTSTTGTAYNTAAQGQIMAGPTPVTYQTTATLLGIRAINNYGANTQTVIESWRIDSEGTVPGARPATVEVSAVLERHVLLVSTFGLFATGTACGSLNLGGGSVTDSYDSSNMTLVGGAPVTQPSGGNVGTNGNMTLNGTGTIINGSLSTPLLGVGNCTTTGAGLTLTGGSSVSEGMDQMPQPITFPPPALPSPMPPTSNTNINNGTTCASLGLSAPVCTGTNANPATGGLTLDAQGTTPLLLDNVSVGAGAKLSFTGGMYHINSFRLQGNAELHIVGTDVVVWNIAGVGETNVIDFTGGSVSNTSFVSSRFQLQYAGTQNMKLNGGASTAMMVYAPDASSQLSGGSNFYGSILTKTIDVSGGTDVHYDKHAPNDFGSAGNFMLSSFTWKRN
jgi:hypothetical protein